MPGLGVACDAVSQYDAANNPITDGLKVSFPELALQLARARQNKTQIEPEAFEVISTESEAYQLQSMAAESYAEAQAGYKVGATNEASQKLFGCDGPFFGPLHSSNIHESNASINLIEGILGGEAEFAFLIDRDIPADAELDHTGISNYIRSVHVAVELIGRRTVGDGLPSLFTAIADFGGNAGFIHGPAIDNWQSKDLASVEVVARVDGEVTNSGSGAAVMGHPLNSLLWLHQNLREQGKSLTAGQWVTTVTCLGVIQARPGTTVEITFSDCGIVGYQLT